MREALVLLWALLVWESLVPPWLLLVWEASLVWEAPPQSSSSSAPRFPLMLAALVGPWRLLRLASSAGLFGRPLRLVPLAGLPLAFRRPSAGLRLPSSDGLSRRPLPLASSAGLFGSSLLCLAP